MSLIVEAFRAVVADRGSSSLGIWSRGEGLRLDTGQVAEAACAWRRELCPHLGPGPVAVATGNTSALVEIFLALRELDRPMVTIDGSMAFPELVQLCRRLGVGTLVHRHGGSELALAGPRADHRLVGGSMTLTDFGPDGVRQAPAGTALVKLTSGTTGSPVGICLDETALLAGIRQIGEGMGLRPDDRVLVAVPLSHSYGFDNGILSFVVLGTPLVLEPRYFPASLLNAIREAEATFFPLVPPLAASLAETAWPSDLPLRTVICAGGRLDPTVMDRFRKRSGRPIHQFYGSTETGGISFERSPEDPDARGTVGHPLPGVDVSLGADGRVRVESAACYGGVLGVDERIERRTVATSDLAAWTPAGRLRLTGRANEFLNVGGRKVSVPAVETALRALHGVREAAVIGVEDPIRGDRLVAFVVAPDGFSGGGPLPWGLAPRDVRVVDHLPYTERGKLDRQSLLALARRRTA